MPENHSHLSSVAKLKAVKFLGQLKKKPQSQPSQILTDLNVTDVPLEVAAHLPDVQNIKQTIMRSRATKLPANSQAIDDLEYIPRRYSVTKDGKPCLLYDSQNDEVEDLDCGRIIIFATEDSLRRLFQ